MTRAVSVVGLALVSFVLVVLAPRPVALADARWSTFLELGSARAYAQAVGLPTGEILVIGGLDRDDPNVTTGLTELIDPVARATRAVPGPILGRLNQSLTLGARERVVAAGGVVRDGERWRAVDRVEVFDLRTRTWSLARPLQQARSDHAAVALADGRVMVIGGNDATTLLSSVELYDSRTDTWRSAAPLPRARTQHTAVLLRDGRVLVVGGIDSDGGATDTTFLYDPRTDTWADGPRMTVPRLQQATVLLPSGDVLFAGGDGDAAGTSELYLASEGRFVRTGSLTEPRLVAQAAALPDGRVLLTGGLPPTLTTYRPLASVEYWDPLTRAWTPLTPLPEGRAWGRLVFVRGSVYLVSGTENDERAPRTVLRMLID